MSVGVFVLVPAFSVVLKDSVLKRRWVQRLFCHGQAFLFHVLKDLFVKATSSPVCSALKISLPQGQALGFANPAVQTIFFSCTLGTIVYLDAMDPWVFTMTWRWDNASPAGWDPGHLVESV